MARDEPNREDLLREATALVERIELAPISGESYATGCASTLAARVADPIIVGFRSNGAASFFFGDDPVYQFNAAGELRRAYCDGLLFKAVNGQLTSLERARTATETELRRRDLLEDDRAAFHARLDRKLSELTSLLTAGNYKIIGQVPAEVNVLQRVQQWLTDHRDIVVAPAPNV